MSKSLIDETRETVLLMELGSLGSDFIVDILQLPPIKGRKGFGNQIIDSVNSILSDCKDGQFAHALTTLKELEEIQSKIVQRYIPELREPIENYLSTL
jgi:hypothetical protein